MKESMLNAGNRFSYKEQNSYEFWMLASLTAFLQMPHLCGALILCNLGHLRVRCGIIANYLRYKHLSITLQ